MSAPNARPLLRIPVGINEAPTLLTNALLDSGASSNFVDETFLSLVPAGPRRKPTPEAIYLADGKPAQHGAITHEVDLTILLGNGVEPYFGTFQVTKIALCELVLGIPFFETVNPVIDWRTRTISSSQSVAHELRIVTVSERELAADPEWHDHGGVVWLRALDTTADMATAVPEEYQSFADVFSKRDADRLPPHRAYDHRIPLLENQEPSFGPIYSLSITEQAALRQYIDDNLRKGFIRPSESPAASPILFVKKKDGTLRLCVDYRRLNAITKRNLYPLPLIGDLLDRLRTATVYTKLDLRVAYNLLRIAEGEEWKTAFRTRFGLFEYRVMPFGLTNAPASFQHLMNDVFRDMLDISVIIYLDDILVFSDSLDEHRHHVSEVLSRLRRHQLYAKAEKCEFHVSCVEFLGFIVSPDGVRMDPKKVAAVLDWPTPKSKRDVQSFLGFANFYRRFIQDFGAIAFPLHGLTHKDTVFFWSDDHQSAFDRLKRSITSDPVLRHFDPSVECVVETDASDFALGAVLSQNSGDGLRPVAFASRSLKGAELNYPIHDKEMSAIVFALTEWRHYLEGVPVRIRVFSDHKSLETFMTAKQLNRRQARWAQLLADFDFVIEYRPGRYASQPDALSRRADYFPQGVDAPSLDPVANRLNFRPLLSRAQLLGAMAVDGELRVLDSEIIAAYGGDSEFETLRSKAGPNTPFSVDDAGLLRFRSARYVPRALRPQVLHDRHDARHAGHPGRVRTVANIRRQFWWPKLTGEVADYVRHCPTCQRDKVERRKPAGLLKPLVGTSSPWADVSCDLIGELPRSNEFNAILVVVDRLTKMAVFRPTTTNATASGIAQLFIDHVYPRFGLPSRVVSDRGSVFVSSFWRSLAKLLGIDHTGGGDTVTGP